MAVIRPANRIRLPAITLSGSDAAPLTGLLFPSNGSESDASTTRFKFTGAALVPPFPATYIFKYRPDQQTGFYTTFFHGPDGTSIAAFTGLGYYGCNAWPPGGSSGTTHNWEISVETLDDITDENANDTTVVKDGTFYTQAVVAQEVAGSELQVDFYWDLVTSSTRLISHTTVNDYATSFPPSNPCLTFGCASWQPNIEMLSGVLRGLQIYSGALTLQQIQDRMNLTTDAAVVAADPGSLWYCNLNPTPDDIADKSGAGHHPAWHNGNHGTLWEP